MSVGRTLLSAFTNASKVDKNSVRIGVSPQKIGATLGDTFTSAKKTAQTTIHMAGLRTGKPVNQQPLLATLAKRFEGVQNTPIIQRALQHQAKWTNSLKPTHAITHVSQLRPALAATNPKLIVLDKDDTLIPILGGKEINGELVKILKEAQQKGTHVGILSNNPFPGSMEKTKDLLSKAGLDVNKVHIIPNAKKPDPGNFANMLAHFNQGAKPGTEIKPSQAVMIGDGLINDIRGANLAGFKSIHVNWFNNSQFEHSLAFSLDQLSHVFNPVYTAITGHLRQPGLLGHPTVVLPQAT